MGIEGRNRESKIIKTIDIDIDVWLVEIETEYDLNAWVITLNVCIYYTNQYVQPNPLIRDKIKIKSDQNVLFTAKYLHNII